MIIWGNSSHGFATNQTVTVWPVGSGISGIAAQAAQAAQAARGTVPWLFPYPRHPTRKDISRSRERFGIQDEYAVAAIAQVARRQAERLERDEQKRFEELERELQLRGIEWEARYLDALNALREHFIDEEIASFMRERQAADEAEILQLLLLAAAVVT